MSFWQKEVIQPALDSGLGSAIGEQEEILQKDPSNPRPYFALGTLTYLRGETDRAIQFFLKAIDLDPAYAAPHVSLGRIYAIQADYDRAWKHAKQAAICGDRSLLEQLERYPNALQTRR